MRTRVCKICGRIYKTEYKYNKGKCEKCKIRVSNKGKKYRCILSLINKTGD